jgi:hypothetical protein
MSSYVASMNPEMKAIWDAALAKSKDERNAFNLAVENLKRDMEKRIQEIHDEFKDRGKQRSLETIRNLVFHALSKSTKDRAPNLSNAFVHAQKVAALLDSMFRHQKTILVQIF